MMLNEEDGRADASTISTIEQSNSSVQLDTSPDGDRGRLYQRPESGR
jgi:hypothetical protein